MANGQLTLTTFPTSLTPMMVLAGNSLRNYLLIQNIGASEITIGLDMTVTPTTGVVLAPMGTSAPGQGGFLLFPQSGEFVPSNQIWAVSAAAGMLAIFEG